MKDLADFQDVVRNISFSLFESWEIIAKRAVGEGYCYLQVRDTKGVCNKTGQTYTWGGRKYILSPYMTETEIVKTALVAVLAAIQHEALECFTYKGLPIFDPHISVDFLLSATTKDMDSRT